MKYEKKLADPENGRMYRVTIQERVNQEMEDWFDGMQITEKEGTTILEGRLIDQSELQGLLRKIHDLHLTLISVETISEQLH